MPLRPRALRAPALALVGLVGLVVAAASLVLAEVATALLALLVTAGLVLLVLLPGRVVPPVVRRVRADAEARSRTAAGRHDELVRALRAVEGRARAAEESAAAARAGAGELRAEVVRLGAELVEVRRAVEGAQEAVGSAREDLARLATTASQALTPGTLRQELGFATRATGVDTWSMLRLAERFGGRVDLPAPGRAKGWAATAETLLALVDEISRRPPGVSVLECGSGTSTLWLAAAVRELGAGAVVAVEHSPHYADETRRALARAGLQDWATVVVAELAPAAPDAVHRTPWYDLDEGTVPAGVDLLFVDGPPGGTGPRARYPAVPRLVDRLADGAVVVLDDTDRREEQEVVRAWVEESGGRLEVVGRTDRATLLQHRLTPRADETRRS